MKITSEFFECERGRGSWVGTWTDGSIIRAVAAFLAEVDDLRGPLSVCHRTVLQPTKIPMEAPTAEMVQQTKGP